MNKGNPKSKTVLTIPNIEAKEVIKPIDKKHEPSHMKKLNSVGGINSVVGNNIRSGRNSVTIKQSDKQFKFDIQAKISDLNDIHEVEEDNEQYEFKSAPHLRHSRSNSSIETAGCIILN